MIDEGLALLDCAVTRRLPGPFQIQAAISALHVQAQTPDKTDWQQIYLLYSRLEALMPTPVVRLNRIVALAETGKIAQARRQLQSLSGDLSQYQPFHAARADLARRDGDVETAIKAYDQAIDLSKSPVEKDWLATQRDGL